MNTLSKKHLRNHFRSVVKNINTSVFRSRKVIDRLIKLQIFQQAVNVLLYYSKDTEVKTEYLIKHCMSQKKNIFLPFVKHLEIGQITKLSKLKPGKYGIFIPNEAATKDKYKKLDLMILPGLVFDKKGYRLGSGSAWYDRFITKYKIKVPKIGLAFEEQIIDELPIEKHDERLDFIVTDKITFDF